MMIAEKNRAPSMVVFILVALNPPLNRSVSWSLDAASSS